MNCPKCDSSIFTKDGIVKQKQRYKCKKCNFRYTVKKRSPKVPNSTKRFAIELYLEGLGFRAIERLLGVSNVSVMNWVAEHAKKLVPLKSPTEPTIIEIDELHSYVDSKKILLDMDCC
mmetsp:Transcript_262/g.123  ORF Transcript_262/g.123 Transcript_262/m.123 type:complete len:118 (-) Transcript_262:2486-2839(-)